MNPAELQSQYVAILKLRELIIEWDNTSPNDIAHAKVLRGLRLLYKKQTRAYADNGGESHCPIA